MISAARVLADWIDHEGGWDWSDGSGHDPSDRLAVVTVRRAGAPRCAAVVYRGTEPDAISLYPTRREATVAMREQALEIGA